MKKTIRCLALSFIGAGAGLLLYCGSFYVKSYLENIQAQKQYESIRRACVEENANSRNASLEEKDISLKRRKSEKGKRLKKKKKTGQIKESFGISWENLRKINPDVKGWITIPGADISYPIVQGDNDDFYLKHSIEKTENPFGSIFLGYGHDDNFLDSHSIVYGHNMEGGMMFANLNRYEDRAFWESCPQFLISTPKRQFIYEIFAVEQAYEESMAFQYGYKRGSKEYREQLEILKENSMYETDIFPKEQQRMVSLVTCNSRLETNVRMVIHGICRQILTENDG